MKKYISTNLIKVIKNLNNKATSAVLFNSSIGDWFRITVGVREGCLLSPTLFNVFLERVITDALENHEGTLSMGGRTITNLHFADDIDGLAGEEELAKLVVCRQSLHTCSINKEISVNGQKLETVTSFKYLSSVLTDEGSKPEILSRIAQTAAD